MASLLSYRTVYITAVRLANEQEDLRGITHVRWEGGHVGNGQDTIEALIVWMDAGGDAYVRLPGGDLGPQVDVVDGETHRYIRSNPNDEKNDNLLSLPRF